MKSSDNTLPMSPEPAAPPGCAETLLSTGMATPPARPDILATLDRFELIHLLGQGAMAQVFLARDTATDAQVAIKMILPEFAREPWAVRRFLREARHMRRLSHPSILNLLEIRDRPEGPYFVMPYVAGGSLAARIRRGRTLPSELVMDVTRQVAGALHAAHSRGVIHRDIKPSNVLLDAQGHAFVADFGLVRTVFNDSLLDASKSQTEGTPPYMSPAVARGQAEDTRCDIYALGCLMYEMMTGRPPYEGTSVEAILNQVMEGPPRPIRELNPDAHPHLAQIAEGAMARELRDRYATASDVAEDIERVQSGREPIGPLAWSLAHRRTRRVARLARIAAGVIGSAAAAGLIWHLTPRAQEPIWVTPLKSLTPPQQNAWKENQAALNEKLRSFALAKAWPSEWKWEGMWAPGLRVAGTNECPPHTGAIVEGPAFALVMSKFIRRVRVRSANTVLGMRLRAESDTYLCLYVDGKRMWEDRPTPDWRTCQLDLSPFAGKAITLAIVHACGGRAAIYSGERIWWDEVWIGPPLANTTNVIALAEVPPRQVKDWMREWTIVNNVCAFDNEFGLQPFDRMVDGREYVFITHPTSSLPCTFSRTCQIPSGKPRLRVVIRALADFLLKVRVDRTLVYEGVIGGVDWTTLDLDLTRWAGGTSEILLEHHGGGENPWCWEHACWADIRVVPDATHGEKAGSSRD